MGETAAAADEETWGQAHTERRIDVWVDGSIRREPGRSAGGRIGHAGAAWVMEMEQGDTRLAGVPYTWTGKKYALGLESNNEEVELIAIRYALQYLEQRIWRTNGFFGDVVVIHCDCKPALRAIRTGIAEYPEYGVELQRISAIKDRIESGALARPVIFRWVRRDSTPGNVKADVMATSAAYASELGWSGFVWDVGTPDNYPAYRP